MRGRGSAIPIGILLVLSALVVLAAPPTTPDLSGPPIRRAEADTEKNCYLPAEEVVILLRNVGTITLFYDYQPNFVVWNETIGYVREATDGYPHIPTRIAPGANITWHWDGRWDLLSGGHKGELVPQADYVVIIQVLQGFPNPELVQITGANFSIGGCLAQIGAGEDLLVDEGQNFTFDPLIQITGNASVTSVTWDLDPTADASGDGNATNDADLVGRNPTHAFRDDGVYPVVMNLRGFGQVHSKTRLDQDVVFAIDGSGSMATADPFGSRKDAAKGYVDRLAPDDRAAVVEFSDSARMVNGHHLSMDYGQVKADIDTIGASGGSYLAGGIFLGLFELQGRGDPSSVWLEIFISDGDSTVLRDHFDIPRAIDFAKDLGVKVYTVGLKVTDPGIEALLEQIANETGGRYFPTPNANDLAQILEEIGDDVDRINDRFFVVSDEILVTVRNVDPTATAFVTIEGTTGEHDDDDCEDDDEDQGDEDEEDDEEDEDSGDDDEDEDDDEDDDDDDEDEDDEDEDDDDEDENEDEDDCPGPSPNLIADPGFESGSLVLTTQFVATPPSFGFWSGRDNQPQPPRLVNSPNPVHAGAWAAEIDTHTQTFGEHLIQDFNTSSASYVWTFWIYPVEGFNVVEVVYNWDRGITGSSDLATAVEYGPAGTVFHAWDAQANFTALAPNSWHEVRVIADACAQVQDYFVDGSLVGSVQASGGVPSPGNATVIFGDVSNLARHGLFYHDDYTFSEFVCGQEDDDEDEDDEDDEDEEDDEEDEDSGDDDEDEDDDEDDDDDDEDEDEDDEDDDDEGGQGSRRVVRALANVTDPGSDDITVTWNWGDGSVDAQTFFHDGVGPDPFPSPAGASVNLTAIGEHRYRAHGTYTVTLTVTDDDGGTFVLTFIVNWL